MKLLVAILILIQWALTLVYNWFNHKEVVGYWFNFVPISLIVVNLGLLICAVIIIINKFRRKDGKAGIKR